MPDEELAKPVMDGSEQAPREARIRAIRAQVQNDTAMSPDMDIEELLRQRFREAQIEFSEDEIHELSRHDDGAENSLKAADGSDLTTDADGTPKENPSG